MAAQHRAGRVFPGGFSGGVTPVPIPNTVAKPSSADGTGNGAGVYFKRPRFFGSEGFFVSRHDAGTDLDRVRIKAKVSKSFIDNLMPDEK